MHTILGAGGPIANALQKDLESANLKVKLASRRQIITSGNTTWFKTDLTNQAETLSAVKGSEVVYLCVGLVYNHEVWQQQWPVIMRNVIDAVAETGARLIFFDNVYMYGPVKCEMTETTPYNPVSKKGEVRARVADMLMNEVKSGSIKASIARAPDFYGAESLNSFFDMMVMAKYQKKQSAQWLGNPNSLHSFILVSDAAKAVALLGSRPDSDNEIWHLPTAKPLRGKELLALAADAFDTNPKFMKVNRIMLQAIGLFDKMIKNSVEMYYQYEHDYCFNSGKFEKAFNFTPTSYRDGINHLAKTMFKN